MIVKKLTAFILTIIMVLTCCINSSVAFAQTVETTSVEEKATVETTFQKGSYLEYMSSYTEAVASDKDINLELDSAVIETEPVTFNVNVSTDGLYTVGMKYKTLDQNTNNLIFGLKIDGSYPYSEAEQFEIPRMWCDAKGENRVDGLGNEFAAKQVIYDGCYFNYVVDESLKNGYKYLVYLTSGSHSVTIVPQEGKFEIEYFEFGASKETQKYQKPVETEEYYTGEPIVIEGEDAAIKSSYFLVGKSDPSTVKITPNNPTRNVINYIGGGNWKTIGNTIVWQTPELEAGYYQLGFSYRQNSLIGGKTYRSLTIDGESPFAEAEAIGFAYDDNWQNSVFSDLEGNPYMIYLSKGTHEIALTVVAGDIAPVRELLTDAVADLGNLYIDITMITGENVDIYRDYNLFSQISDMEEKLNSIRNTLKSAGDMLLKASGQSSGSNYSVINNMIEVINQMLNNKFEAHRYKDSYYSNYCSVSSVLQDLRNMPLDIDKMVLFASEGEAFEKYSFVKQIGFSVQRFFKTFVQDYSNISASNEGDELTIWVNWGRDQAQVLNSLVTSSFTQETGINVNLQLVNATVVQAILSGDGPDCILQHSRSEPVNLAMRGALYDLTQFSDYEQVLERFQKGAESPYRYKGGLYALPDKQTFFMMFYRKDILEEFGIKVPNSWEDFSEATKTLMRNNMSVWMPNNTATNNTQINAGVGSVNIFPSMLLQNGLSLYAEDGKRTNLLTADVMEVFGNWTDFYKKQKLPVTLDFYNRFRIGITPIGISPYSLYTTLKVAAPEIDGLWGMTAVPGTVREDGTVDHTSAGGGTACAILNASKQPDKAWEFLKWWTRADIQLTYSNDVESILGPLGRETLSNVEAIKGLSWDEGMLDELLNAWEQVEEIPEYPGSYYVTRSIYQSFWNVVNANKNTKDVLMKFGKEADDEMARKWKQYTNRR